MNKEILKDLKILYVEDENDVREFTCKILQTVVKEVVLAENGLAGVEAYNNNKDIDLIVTDINMPKMNGFEMCREIKKDNSDIPIVITSAHNDPDFLKEAIDVGVNAYAMKPIDLYQLIDNIVMAVEPFYLKKQLEEVNMSLQIKVEEGIKQIKSILDAQDNIVVVTDGTVLHNANKKFLEFFNYESLESFSENNQCIDSFFIEDEGFFSSNIIDDDELWFNYMMLNLNELDRIVKMKNNLDEERVFTVNIDNFEAKSEYFVISFTDITQLKAKSNLFEYQATHDTLTGLFNRQKFHDIFSKEVRRDKRYKNSLSLIIYDIDFFKRINDNYGHLVGDQVLKDLSSLVASTIREHDTVVRWGGEEFVVLLPQTDLEGAVNAAKKLQDVVTTYRHPSVNEKITLSFGVTLLKDDDTEESIIRRADEALYQAKEEGRDRIVSL